MRVYIIALLALTSCIENPEPKVIHQLPNPENAPAIENQNIIIETVSEELSLKIIESEHGGYGFEILQGANPLIIQPHIPAIQGTKGFESKEQAETIGNYMMYKIENGIMPPSISIFDLDSLNINY